MSAKREIEIKASSMISYIQKLMLHGCLLVLFAAPHLSTRSECTHPLGEGKESKGRKSGCNMKKISFGKVKRCAEWKLVV